ncbi:MAG: GCN5-related N-acetyltransferase [Osedax symbiont Rs1]|nr:MAG: GCN5-related N-acetyltransferase [Osedax symbiont Rs1]
MIIRYFCQSDFVKVQAIYQQGIATANATFQTSPKSWQQWQDSMIEASVLVSVDSESQKKQLKGWAGLSPVSTRAVYSGVAEVSIYVAQGATGMGIGSQLMAALIERAESLGFWTMQAAIFPENELSIALHIKFGFTIIGQRKAIAKLQGKWRDVVLLERRSTLVGVD